MWYLFSSTIQTLQANYTSRHRRAHTQKMELKELAFIPFPAAGHLAPMVELAKVFTTRDDRFSATIFNMEFPSKSNSKSNSQSLLSNHSTPRVQFVHLTLDEATTEHLVSKPIGNLLRELVQVNKSRVKDFYSTNSSHPIAFIVDMMCTPFADVACEFGAPTYAFFTSSACFLSLMFHLQSLNDNENRDIGEFKESDIELSIPGFAKHVPTKVLPSAIFDKENGHDIFLDIPRKLRKTQGILVNTFAELESYPVKCLSEDYTLPPIHTVGPLLNLKPGTGKDENALVQYEVIMSWLDNQPPKSVVFLCFGSRGAFEKEQVTDIAHAMEQSGHRFLWALRRPPPKGEMALPSEYENFNEVLPEGFLDRTKDIGKVIGWAPQVAVLSHPSVGGFISHCGWNSILESLWCGVPMATWPLYSEQQMNAFEMVKELGLAVEIKLDYQRENPVFVTAKEIERGIRQLMEDSYSKDIKNKVKALREESRKTVMEGGSSYSALEHVMGEALHASL